MSSPPHPKLEDGSRVAVIGGGPAGSFFSYFLLQMAERLGMKLHLDMFEPRDFTVPGPRGCNMCGGIISESLVQNLATEGIHIPPTVIQRRIDSYFLHMDTGSVRIATPLQEMRIAAVARGAGPRTVPASQHSFDAYLLQLARDSGTRQVHERVTGIIRENGRPVVKTRDGSQEGYDLVVGAVGANSPLLKQLEGLGDYKPPRRTKAWISEFHMGKAMIERYLGNSMHVFLLNLPRLDFAAIIPKSEWATVVLLGVDIDKDLIGSFLESNEVRECLPPHWRIPTDFCHCAPRLNIDTAVHPFGDRVAFIGDCGTSRLFKDGIGAAYRTAKAAAKTAVFRGVADEDFRHSFWPACRTLHTDNRIGKMVFAFTRQIQKRRYARRGLWRMVSLEQKKKGSKRRMSMVLWDTFTGSAPYKSVFLRTLHPSFFTRFAMEIAAGIRSGETIKPKKRLPMATGGTGLLGKKYNEGDVIFHQGDRGDCMYVIQGGEVEVIRREGDQEFCVAVLSDGDFFGEMALFDEETRPATVRALRESYIFTLERNGLLRRLHEDPSMAFRFIERMSKRINKLESSLIRHAKAHAPGDRQ
jgi:flavin-dependent dehydrogenase